MQIDQRQNRDRRQRRSSDTMTALHYQLSSVRHDGGLEALVLADAAGCLVAGAGAWPTCEMLAAYAPLLARRVSANNGLLASTVGAVNEGTEVRSLSIDGNEVLLCARGGRSSRGASIARAASGCRRILGGEA
jgi:hypothetical protein